MNLQEFKQALLQHLDHQVAIQFDNGMRIAPHFHVTEIGKVTKDFVDCGGTRRMTVSCVLQTLVADDVDHRLTSDKLAGIIEKAAVLDLADDLPVEVELQTDTIGVYAFNGAIAQDGIVVFSVQTKQTACLAPDKCGLDSLPIAGQTNCC